MMIQLAATAQPFNCLPTMLSDYARRMHPLLERVPRLQLLAVFESAGRLGSFTKAASELGITQPAVSRHIRDLERSTGVALFSRSANRVRLSADGEMLLGVVQQALAGVNDHLRSSPRSPRTFLLAANPGFAQQWLVPHLDRLQSALDDVDLWLRLFDRNQELEDDAFDAAIHLTPVSQTPTGTRLLFSEVVVPVASPECAASLSIGPDSQPEDLFDLPKLHLDNRDRHWLDWTGWFAAHGRSWSPTTARLSYNNYALVMNDAIAGRGIALAWRGLVDSTLDSGGLVSVGPDAHNPVNAYQLIPAPSASPEIVERVARWLDEVRNAPLPHRCI